MIPESQAFFQAVQHSLHLFFEREDSNAADCLPTESLTERLWNEYALIGGNYRQTSENDFDECFQLVAAMGEFGEG
jgi:hypothetical protein